MLIVWDGQWYSNTPFTVNDLLFVWGNIKRYTSTMNCTENLHVNLYSEPSSAASLPNQGTIKTIIPIGAKCWHFKASEFLKTKNYEMHHPKNTFQQPKTNVWRLLKCLEKYPICFLKSVSFCWNQSHHLDLGVHTDGCGEAWKTEGFDGADIASGVVVSGGYLMYLVLSLGAWGLSSLKLHCC